MKTRTHIVVFLFFMFSLLLYYKNTNAKTYSDLSTLRLPGQKNLFASEKIQKISLRKIEVLVHIISPHAIHQ